MQTIVIFIYMYKKNLKIVRQTCCESNKTNKSCQKCFKKLSIKPVIGVSVRGVYLYTVK